MISPLHKMLNNVIEIISNPLYRNSLFIASSKIVNAAIVGFLFWSIAAHLYSIEDIGVATALISSTMVIVTFSLLGLDIALIRYIPSYNKDAVFSTSLWITIIITTLVSGLYLLLINVISPSIAFIQNYSFLFILFTLLQLFVLITGRAYIGLNESKYFFIQNLLLALRIPLLLPLIFLNSMGIFLAVGIGFVITSIFTSLMLKKFIKIKFEIDFPLLKKMFSFSIFNYFSNLFSTIPTYFMPILILNLLGAAAAAQYFIAFAIGSIILIIPDSISLSFFVQGSHTNIVTKRDIKRVLINIFLILVPSVCFIFLFGDKLLGLFGKNYSSAFNLLKLFALSSFFVAIFNLFISVQNIRMIPKTHAFLNLFYAIIFIGLSYYCAITFGIEGVGFAWIITYIILDIAIILLFVLNKNPHSMLQST
jgi:O-antigen/teichoic acid export membrane protein